jgi:hypothetical protein
MENMGRLDGKTLVHCLVQCLQEWGQIFILDFGKNTGQAFGGRLGILRFWFIHKKVGSAQYEKKRKRGGRVIGRIRNFGIWIAECGIQN